MIRAQQLIKVIDFETSFPIEGVKVSSPDSKYIFHTNKEGFVSLRTFRKKDSIIFTHPEYETYRTTKKEIWENGRVVQMIKHYQKLDNVVLSVSRTSAKKNTVAKQVKIIDRIETMKIMPATAADLLELTGGLMIQKSQGGAGSPIIRGLEANRVLLVMDGIRLNNAISRTGHLHTAVSINPLIMDRTEIIYGPSSIYGSDALGGVINFYTHTPVVNNTKEIEGEFLGRFATANNETTFHVNTEVSQPVWASFFALTFSDYGDIKMGSNRLHGYDDWGLVPYYSENDDRHYFPTPTENPDPNIQPNTAFDQKDFFNKTIINLSQSKKNKLILLSQYNYTGKVNRFDKLTEEKGGTLKYAEWYYGPAERLLFSPQLELEFSHKYLQKAKIILAYQNWDESRVKRKFNSLERSYQEENVKVYSLNADFTALLPHNKSLLYGFESSYNKVNSHSFSKILTVNANEISGLTDGPAIPTRYPDGGSSYLNFAAYSSLKFKLGRKTYINTGIRFTQTYLKAKWTNDTFINLPDNDIELANFALTGNINYVYRPDNLWKFDLILSSGFRSPNIDDIGKVREKKGKVTVPNIYLKPEYAYNTEAGIARFFNHGKLNLSGNIYYTLLNNYIARDSFEIQPGIHQILYDGEWVDTYANVNKGNAYIYGGSLVIDGAVNQHIDLEGGIFYTKGKMIDADRPLPSIPPFFGNFKATYKWERLETSLLYKFMLDKPLEEYDVIGGIDNIEQSPYNEQTGEYEGFPKWHIFNAYATYYYNKNLIFNLGVENIFDVHYKEFASAISAPGRNFKFQIRIKL
jgi:hemoglobin/transferrin/lactoferrin receptor protein